MSIFRLNHAVLFVADLQRSVEFYRNVLGFDYVEHGDKRPKAAFLRAPRSTNDHDLGLIEVGAGRAAVPGGVGLYHLAWEVDTLTDLAETARRLSDADSLYGSSDHGTTKSLYARDPDGLEFEVAWLVPADLLDDAAFEQRTRRGVPLDLQKEKARYGAGTRGGVGVSSPAAALP